jgi:predicted Holliday junction resolvase-like endonuclease
MTYDTAFLIIFVLATIIIVLLAILFTSPRRSAAKAQALFQQWRLKELDTAKQELNRVITAEYDLKMLQWRGTYEANIRADAITRSAAVIRGKVVRALGPFYQLSL